MPTSANTHQELQLSLMGMSLVSASHFAHKNIGGKKNQAINEIIVIHSTVLQEPKISMMLTHHLGVIYIFVTF